RATRVQKRIVGSTSMECDGCMIFRGELVNFWDGAPNSLSKWVIGRVAKGSKCAISRKGVSAMPSHIKRVLLALLLMAFAASAQAQERYGGLSGQVTDPSQGAVPGATITITNKASGAVRTAVSNADGSYSIPDLEPGRYTVVFELSGFQKVSNDD